MGVTVLRDARPGTTAPARVPGQTPRKDDRQPTHPEDLRRYFGISRGHGCIEDAERWLRSLQLPRSVEVCTHLALSPHPHVAISLATAPGTGTILPAPGPVEFHSAAAQAAAAHATRTSGRATHFQGAAALIGAMSAMSVLKSTAIERITVLGHGPADLGDIIAFDDRVRPRWTDGRLTLVTTPTAHGHLRPLDDTCC